MNRQILLILSHDPRHSGRVAEGLRIAAGLRAWQKVDVSVFLRGDAVRALAEDTSDFLDEEILVRYLAALKETRAALFAEAGCAGKIGLARGSDVREIAVEELAGLAANCDATINF